MKTTTRRGLLLSALGLGSAMSLISDDPLADLFAPDQPGPAQPMAYRQGTIIAFNSVTLQNTVKIDSATFTDLPLLGVAEAASLVPGSVVGIMQVGSTWAIIGRFVTPNTPAAADAISLLSNQIESDFIATGETCSSSSYGDLATVGPRVTVTIGPSGRLLLICTAQIQWLTANFAAPVGDGRFDVEFTGANTRSPNEVADPLVGILRLVSGNNAGTPTSGIAARASLTAQAVFSGLNPGDTTITMKYRVETDDNASPVQFFRRTVTAVRL